MKRTALLLVTFTLLAALTWFAQPPMAHAGGQVTNCSNDTDFSNKLVGGGTVTFNCGTMTINLSSTKTIAANTVIDGEGKITLSGTGSVRLFLVNSNINLTLKNIVLESGYGGSEDGGAIWSRGNLVLDRTTFQFNYSPLKGGAIYSEKGPIEVTGSTFADNTASSGAAIAMYNGKLSITNSTFQSNNASKQGGAILVYSQLEISNSTFAHNTARNGGAIFGDPSIADIEITIDKTTFDDNDGTEKYRGGAIQTTGKLTLTGSKFLNNHAGAGGAIYISPGAADVSITGSLFHDNKTEDQYPEGNGAALLVEAQAVTVQDSTFHNNNGQSGGAIYVLAGGELTMLDSTVRDNIATNGGGINNHGKATLTNVTLSGNGTGSGHGGGIDNFATLDLTNVTLSGNAATYGAGIKNEGGSATLTNVTISHNQELNINGGAIFNTGGSTQLYMKNVLVANTSSGPNCKFGQPFLSNETNLSDDNSCNFGAGRDNLDDKLDPLGNNGGKTHTHLPQSGSPAIDSGTFVSTLLLDQRGILRPQGPNFDVGSVEVCQKPGKPELRKPGNGKRGQGPAVALDWNDPVCASKFLVMIRLGSKNGDLIQKKGGLNKSEFTTKPLVKGQTYSWQVKTCRKPYGCAKSDWWTFTVK